MGGCIGGVLGIGLFIFLIWLGPWGWAILVVLAIVGAVQNKKEEEQKAISEATVARPTKVPDEGEIDQLLELVELVESDADWDTWVNILCGHFEALGFYNRDELSPDQVKNAIERLPPPKKGKLVALYDESIDGSGSEGLGIWETGISWRNLLDSAGGDRMTFARFANVEVRPDPGGVAIGSNGMFSVLRGGYGAGHVYSLLSIIQRGYLSSGLGRPSLKEPADIEKSLRREEIKARSPAIPKVPVDVNSASYEELLTLRGIHAAEAKRLLALRESGRRLESVSEMIELLGLKLGLAEYLEESVIFGEPKGVSVDQSANERRDIRPGKEDERVPDGKGPERPTQKQRRGRTVDW